MRSRPSALRDFTVDRRVWLLTGVALFIGAGAAGLAVLLLRAIALATNVFYYHRLSLALVGPAGSPLSRWIMLLIPVLGGSAGGIHCALRFGQDTRARDSRGDRGDPASRRARRPQGSSAQASFGGNRNRIRGAVRRGGADHHDGWRLWLIGGAMASPYGCRTNDVAGGWSAAGMSATFAAPIAAILLAVELLLFEWRPRSLVPVAMASVVAAALRVSWLGPGPLFPVELHASMPLGLALLVACPLGMLVGLASAASEPSDVFPRRWV